MVCNLIRLLLLPLINFLICLDFLIDILLKHRNIMLEIKNPILVQKVVHLLIHSFDDMVANIIALVRHDLEHADLHV